MRNIIKKIQKTCDCCPSQWEITLKDGKMVYVRYRWGHLTIRISKDKTNKIEDAINGIIIYHKQLGNGFDGYMKTRVMKRYLKAALINYLYDKRLRPTQNMLSKAPNFKN